MKQTFIFIALILFFSSCREDMALSTQPPGPQRIIPIDDGGDPTIQCYPHITFDPINVSINSWTKVTWNYTGCDTQIKIAVYADGVFKTYITNGTYQQASYRAFYWIVPYYVASSMYLVAQAPDGTVIGTSASFRYIPNSKTTGISAGCTLFQQNTTCTLVSGTTYTFYFSDGQFYGIPYITIALVDEPYRFVIAENVQTNSSSFTFTMPYIPAGAIYKLRFEIPGFSESYQFDHQYPFPCTFIVTRDFTGFDFVCNANNLMAGDNTSVNWVSSAFIDGVVYIHLYQNQNLITSYRTANNGHFVFRVSSGTNYRVYVSSYYGGLGGYTPYFNVGAWGDIGPPTNYNSDKSNCAML